MRKLISLLIITLFTTSCVSLRPQLGIIDYKLQECPSTPNCVSSMTNDSDYYIEPLIITAKQIDAKKQIITILDVLGNNKITVSEYNYIRAEFSSRFFHFIDDVEFYFPETKSKDIIIHVRSASRVGYSDLGVNRERIELIRSKL